jgi:putative hydrolase of the HAD superfamily
VNSVPVARLDAVIFDWGGTLTPWHTIDPRQMWLAYAGGRWPADPDRAARAADRLLAAEEAAWVAGRDHQRAATLDEVFRTAGVEPVGDGHRRGMAAYEQSWEPHTWTDPDAVPLLAALRERGLRVGVLSNTLWTRAFHEQVFARDGVLPYIDGAVYSSELAYVKPHPEAFRAALAAVGVGDAARAVFVGDRLFDDVHGAKEVGLRTVFVPHSVIPDHQRGHAQGEPDAVAHRLGDVLAIVDSWR